MLGSNFFNNREVSTEKSEFIDITGSPETEIFELELMLKLKIKTRKGLLALARAVNNLIETDKRFRLQVDEIEKKLKM